MDIPTTLKHKPVIVSRDYDKVDGREINSEAKGLSVGLAQWNERGRVDASVKMWRHTGEKWSRQSEELPPHRVLDLAILLCRTISHFREAYRYPKLYDETNPVIDTIALQGGGFDVSVCTENPMIDTDIALLRDALERDSEILGERLRRLADALEEMGY